MHEQRRHADVKTSQKWLLRRCVCEAEIGTCIAFENALGSKFVYESNCLGENSMKHVACFCLIVICVVSQTLIPSNGCAQVIQTAHDHIPDFSANFTISSSSSGPWSSANTWSPARLPGPSDIVRIRHTVTYDSATGDVDVIGIDTGGMLRFSSAQATRLHVGTLLVSPNGVLEVGTPSNPIPASFTAEIIIKNKALNPSALAGSVRHGVVVNRRKSNDVRCGKNARFRSDRR